MTQLSHLCIELRAYRDAGLDISWLDTMTSLCSLDLIVSSSVELLHPISQLTSLTELKVSISELADPSCGYTIFCDVDWKEMRALRHIALTGSASFPDSILGLSMLGQLESVSMTAFHPKNDLTAVNLARLTYMLALHRPQVKLFLRQGCA